MNFRTIRWQFADKFRGLFGALMLCWAAGLCCVGSANAQSVTLNVTNFGAKGDAISFYVSSVSNSAVLTVADTNVFSSADIGKIIEVFCDGPWISTNGIPLVTNQDIICLLTNVVNGTNLYIPIPAGWTRSSVYCTLGTGDADAFQAAVNAAQQAITNQTATNVTIVVPPGQYLLIPDSALYDYNLWNISETQPAVSVSTGGISIVGDTPADTILLGCGAGMEHFVTTSLSWISPGYAPYVPMRATMFYCLGPIAYSQYPFVLQNLTLDGGVTNGLMSYHYWTINQGNGSGWDTTHHAVADSNPNPNIQQMHQMKVFTNCVFQHWRGEVLICWTQAGGTNTFNDIANCTFQDCNATAINLYYGQHTHGCLFNGMVKVEEYYQLNATLPSVFESNVWTNIVSNPMSIVGSVTNVNAPSFTFRSNTFWGVAGINQITFAPAENIVISNNVFHGPANGVVCTGAGLQPANGTASIISNIVVVGNTFNDTMLPISMDGYPVLTMYVSNNTSTSTYQFASEGAYWKTNIVFQGNSGPPLVSKGVTGQWFFDSPSDNFTPWHGDNDWAGQANAITYAYGRNHVITYGSANSTFYIDDAQPNSIPPGATLSITYTPCGGCNGFNPALPIYFSTTTRFATPSMILTNGNTVVLSWTNGAWQGPSGAPPVPPTGLHIVPGG